MIIVPCDPNATIEGVHMLMPEAEVKQALPQLKLSAPAEITGPYRFGHLQLASGARLVVRVAHGRVERIAISNDEAVYPDRGPLPLPPPRTFDVAIVPGLRPRGTAAPDGWCCGLPRGITPAQWPLSCSSGLPLEHHFTVRVPESYRVKGQQYVALAFFGEGEQFKASPEIWDLMGIVFDGRSLPTSVEPNLQPFLDHLRNRHPMEFRSMDVLQATYAAIWLINEDFNGRECEPPELIINALNESCNRPDWLAASSAERLLGWNGKEEFDPERYLHWLAGHKPTDKWELLLLKTTERTDDPNTGHQPVEADRSWLHEQIASIWAEKKAAEAAWPADTDFDRLDRVFFTLNEAGFIAFHCAGNTQSDGWDDTREEWDERGGTASGFHGAICYHGQDVDRATEDRTLYLTYGPMPGSRLTAMEVAHRAVEVLTAAGFSVEAPPDDTLRIEINGLDWKKRSPT